MNLQRWLATGAAVAGAALVTACVPSVHPFFTEWTLVSDTGLGGTWAKPGEETENWRFTPDDDKRFDVVVTDDDGHEGAFVGHLFELEGIRFLDLFPEEPEQIENGFYQYHLLPTHSVMRIKRDGDSLKLAPLNPQWVDDWLKKNPDALAHERTDDRLVLTASTAQLEAFLKEHADKPKVFGDPVTMERRAIDEPDVDEAVDTEETQETIATDESD